MKKLITLLLILVSTNLFSQVEKPITKGNFLIGGSASGGYYSNNNSGPYQGGTYNELYANLYPTLGYFVLKGFAVGLSLNASINRELNSNKFFNLQGGFGPFLKYYTQFGLFTGGQIEYSISSAKNNSKKYSDSNSILVHPNIGYAYFINSKIAFEASLNYSFQLLNRTYYADQTEVENDDYINKYNRLYISIGFQIFLSQRIKP